MCFSSLLEVFITTPFPLTTTQYLQSEDALFNRVLHEQDLHGHGPRLADAVHAVDRLRKEKKEEEKNEEKKMKMKKEEKKEEKKMKMKKEEKKKMKMKILMKM
jgi:hypothetical protein